jgi:hypothetical protein
MNTEHCANFAIAYALPEHGADGRSKLGFVGIAQITFG